MLNEANKTHFLHNNKNLTSNKVDVPLHAAAVNSSSKIPEKISKNISPVPLLIRNATNNGTIKVEALVPKPGLIKLGNSTNKGAVGANYSNRLQSHQILNSTATQLEDHNSNESPPAMKQSDKPHPTSYKQGLKNPKTNHTVNAGIRISLDSADGEASPHAIGVTTYNLGSTTLSLEGLKTKQGKVEEPYLMKTIIKQNYNH